MFKNPNMLTRSTATGLAIGALAVYAGKADAKPDGISGGNSIESIVKLPPRAHGAGVISEHRKLAGRVTLPTLAARMAGEASGHPDRVGGGAQIEHVEKPKYPPGVVASENALQEMNKHPKILNITMTFPATQPGHKEGQNSYFYDGPDKTAERIDTDNYNKGGRTLLMISFPRLYTDKRGQDWIMVDDYSRIPSREPIPIWPPNKGFAPRAAHWRLASDLPKGAILYGSDAMGGKHVLDGRVSYLDRPNSDTPGKDWYLNVPGMSDYSAIAYMDTAFPGQAASVGLQPLKDQNLEHFIHSGK